MSNSGPHQNDTCKIDVTIGDELIFHKRLLRQVIGNYQVAASIAEMEGYETNYEQDKILVDLLLEPKP